MSASEKLADSLRSTARSVLYPDNVPISTRFLQGNITPTWKRVNEEELTYSTRRQLKALVEIVQRAEKLRAPGEIIETGCAYGGSAILMCSAKSRYRPMRIFDVFGMLPEPSSADGADMQQRYREIATGGSKGLGHHKHYAYAEDLESTVRNNFARLGFPVEENSVTLIKGKVQDTLEVNGPVYLAHIDVDWFEPVTASLERIVPHLVPGGAAVLRAYGCWSGCRQATDAYFDRVGRDNFNFRMIDHEALLVERHE